MIPNLWLCPGCRHEMPPSLRVDGELVCCLCVERRFAPRRFPLESMPSTLRRDGILVLRKQKKED